MLNKADRKGSMLYDSIYVKPPEQVNPLRQKTDWWLPAIGEEAGMESHYLWDLILG